MTLKNVIMRLNAGIINSILKVRGTLAGVQTNMRYQGMLAPLVLEAKCRYGKLVFHTPSEITLMRAVTLESKEPETLQWIDTFEDNSCFWDIGANVGCYSLYAAKKGGITVRSFEPSYSNYYLLCKNIEANGLHESVLAYCVALSEKNETGFLNMSTIEEGGAIHNFGSKLDNLNVFGENYKIVFRQGMIGMSIDHFIDVFGQNVPNYIKLDVDGNEYAILCGAKKTLGDKRLKSVLIEIDDEKDKSAAAIDCLMKDCGFEATKNVCASTGETRWMSVKNRIYTRV